MAEESVERIGRVRDKVDKKISGGVFQKTAEHGKASSGPRHFFPELISDVSIPRCKGASTVSGDVIVSISCGDDDEIALQVLAETVMTQIRAPIKLQCPKGTRFLECRGVHQLSLDFAKAKTRPRDSRASGGFSYLQYF